jgi:hypothetical protein
VVNVPKSGKQALSIFDVAMKWLTGISLGSSFLVGVWLGVVANPLKEFDGCEESARFVIAWFAILFVAFSVATGLRIAGRVVTTCFLAGVLLGGPVLMLGSWLGWQFNPQKEIDLWGGAMDVGSPSEDFARREGPPGYERENASCRPFYVGDEFTLIAHAISLGSDELKVEPAGCATTSPWKICAYSDGRLIRLFFQNQGGEDVQVEWSGARYYDENGREHPLAPFPDDLSSPERVPAMQGRWQSVIVAEKRTFQNADGSHLQVVDQFLPFSTDCVRREDIQELHDRKVEPALTMTLKEQGTTRSLTIRFRLENVDTMTFQSRSAERI